MKSMPHYSFVFVCQKGDLEIQAMLLAASLQRFVSCPYEVVVAIPQPTPRYGSPAPSTLRLLESLGARFAQISNQIDPTYPIANKISAMAVSTNGRRRIFLDSDMMCITPFSGDSRLDVEYGATPAARLTWGKEPSDWDKVYELFGLTTPTIRMKTVSTAQDSPPYYNAGFIVAGKDVADALAHTWLECARVIDRNPMIPNTRPWLDQIALPVAVTRLGLSHNVLDEIFNFPGNSKLLSLDPPAYFCHYHTLLALKRLPVLNEVFRELTGRHAALRERVMSHRLWRDVLSSRFGLLDALQALKSARAALLPRGTRRAELASELGKRIRRAVRSR